MKCKIKPCPFCGARAEYNEEMGVILCSDCGFYYEVPTTIKEIAPLWNRRHKPAKSLERIALELACQWIADNAPNSGSRGVLLRHFLTLAKSKEKSK